MASQAEKAARFAALHDTGCFVLPNAWDFASAALTLAEGYDVIATTSAGVAFAQGFADGEAIGRDRMIGFAGGLAARFDVPVTADLEAGYGEAPAAVGATVAAAIAAGLVGCNIEDGVPGSSALYDAELSAARIGAGAEAARAAGLPDFSLNARIDSFLRKMGPPDACLRDAIDRGRRYLAAGARSVFVPGVIDGAAIRTLVSEIGGPLNVMAVSSPAMPSRDELAAIGVRRISLGGAWMLARYGAARDMLKAVKGTGSFALHPAASYGDFMRVMSKG
jgi:2-methylisocitrate lyase-like PEP mutase family enzyme